MMGMRVHGKDWGEAVGSRVRSLRQGVVQSRGDLLGNLHLWAGDFYTPGCGRNHNLLGDIQNEGCDLVLEFEEGYSTVVFGPGSSRWRQGAS